jgi:signal peptidase I
MEKVESKKKNKQIWGFIQRVLITCIALVLLNKFVVTATIYYDNNMFPSIKDGDLVVIEKFDKEVQLSDVVIYNGRLYRVIAKAGQEVDISKEGILTVNGMQPAESTNSLTNKGEKEYPIKVPEGELFVLNDYREDTSDSREFGTIKESDIEGKVFFITRRRGF